MLDSWSDSEQVKRNSRKQVVVRRVKVLVALSCFFTAMMILVNDSSNRMTARRILCETQLSVNSGEAPTGFFSNLVDRILQTTEDPDADCETQFPNQAAANTGSEYYAPDAGIRSGFYYGPEQPDESILTPFDPRDSPYYTPVTTGVLVTYQPGTYDAVGTTRRPENTTAYVVVITGCPEWYKPTQPDVTDPGPELYEASALIKQNVCSAAEETAVRRRKLRSDNSNLRGLQTEDVTPQETYTM